MLKTTMTQKIKKGNLNAVEYICNASGHQNLFLLQYKITARLYYQVPVSHLTS